ncbi:MAG: hypothetical protein ACRDTD_26225 [Pseudonocardiaceae bacterium]
MTKPGFTPQGFIVLPGADFFADVTEAIYLPKQPSTPFEDHLSALDDDTAVTVEYFERQLGLGKRVRPSDYSLPVWDLLRQGTIGARGQGVGVPIRVVTSDRLLAQANNRLRLRGNVPAEYLPDWLEHVAGQSLRVNDGFIVEFGLGGESTPREDLLQTYGQASQMVGGDAGIILLSHDRGLPEHLPADPRVSAMTPAGFRNFGVELGIGLERDRTADKRPGLASNPLPRGVVAGSAIAGPLSGIKTVRPRRRM